jgi:hypothetical protein
MPNPNHQPNGTVVRYAMKDGPAKGQIRGAIVCGHLDTDPKSPIDIWVLVDPRTDGPSYQTMTFVPGVEYNNALPAGTWAP